MLLLSDDEAADDDGNIIPNHDEGDYGKAEEEGECQILDILGLADNTTISPQTLKLRGELRGIPI